MRYIGGKTQLLSDIHDAIRDVAPGANSVIDLFSGSGVVAEYLKQQNYEVICNDQMYFSYVLLRGITQISSRPQFSSLKIDDPVDYLNSLTYEDSGIDIKDCFIYQNYAPHDDCERMYFTPENAIKIDIIRITIEHWRNEDKITEDEYYYLLASLISAVPYVSNIAGVYAAYLKHWDPRAHKGLELKYNAISKTKVKVKSYNEDYTDLLGKVKADVLYSDSPYNTREYLPNYHILETIAKYDYPAIKGITGMREYKKQKSDFCSKATVSEAFERMISMADVKYVIISYNNEGLISTEELSRICEKYAEEGTFKLIEIPYRRYKSKIPNKKAGLMEQLYCFKKAKCRYVKSPFNYIGGKHKLLPQIEALFPKHINKMLDLFCGGCDVAVNTIAKEVYANDINNFVIEILSTMQENSIEDLLCKIDNNIAKWGLTKTDKDAYMKFRDYYNKTHDPIDLYTLMCYSFNYQFRFNSSHEYNNPFGKDRSCFSDTMRDNLKRFHRRLSNIHFSSENFKSFDISCFGKGDFIYADPPYLITTGTYNDGKRGFEGWTAEDDAALFKLLDEADKKGIKFALSNVIKHKGITNEPLIAWSKKYTVHYLDYNYNNSNYHSKNTDKETSEVLITNY